MREVEADGLLVPCKPISKGRGGRRHTEKKVAVEEEKEDQIEEDQIKEVNGGGAAEEKQTENLVVVEAERRTEAPVPWLSFRSVPLVSSG